jgi:hypothetical protein
VRRLRIYFKNRYIVNGFIMNSKYDKDHVTIEIRESIAIPLIIVGIIIYFISYGLYKMTDEAKDIGLPIYVLIVISVAALLFYYILSLGKRSIIMSLTQKGIYLANSKLIRWDAILSIKKRTVRGDEGTRFLVLQTVHTSTPHEIDITNMAISEKKLAKQIQKFRAYHIHEVEVD